MSQPTNGHRPIPAQSGVQQPAATVQPAAAQPPAFPERADDDVPWARQVTNRRPNTSRNRRIVRDLPGWDPLPPGESLVHRRRRD